MSSHRWATTIRAVVGLLICGTVILPLLWMITTSLRDPGLVPPRQIEWLPQPLAWSNYHEVFGMLPFAIMARNSVIVTGLAVPLSVLSASLAGFAIAQLPPLARRWMVVFALVASLIPTAAIWVSRFVLFSELGLVDTWWPLILPALTGTSPLFTLVFLWSYLGIPRDVIDAARIDGSSAVRIWATICSPLVRSTTVAVSMLTFTLHWNNFTDPLIYVHSMDRQTLPFALSALFQLAPTDWPLLMAAATMLTAPVVVVFLLGQRAFVNGSRGAGWLSH